jgi:hypothetical protein
MKWIFLAVIAFVLFVVFRRLNRDQRITPESSFAFPTAAPSAGPGMDIWSQRAPMAFDDFYNRYYASAKLDREYVRKTLEFVSKSGGVPADRIRPEDRIDQFPKKNLGRMVRFVEKMLSGPLGRAAQQQGFDPSTFHLETVDDIIRHLEQHQGTVAGHLQEQGEPPREESQWR